MNDVPETPQGTILVFDSGIGGLAVLREVRALLAERAFVYVADDGAFPYGDWNDEPLRQHVIAVIGALLRAHEPDIVVIACNTASTLALSALRAAYPAVAFVGTVPAIKLASEHTRSGLISVLATPATVRRGYTRDLIGTFATGHEINLVGSSRLAPMAEVWVKGQALEDDAVRAAIAPCFVERAGRRTDIVVLACTHYPFLVDLFRRLAPWPVNWMDPASAIARRVKTVSDELPPKTASANRAPVRDAAFFTSGYIDRATEMRFRAFGLTAQHRSKRV